MKEKVKITNFTANRSSFIGACAYRMPRKLYNDSPESSRTYFPRILPRLIVTVGAASQKFKIAFRNSFAANNNKIGKIIFQNRLLLLFMIFFFQPFTHEFITLLIQSL